MIDSRKNTKGKVGEKVMSLKPSKRIILFLLILFFFLYGSDAYGIRVGDLTRVKGIRDNQLFGIGLVMGLSNTGDSSQVTRKMITNMLKELRIQVTNQEVAAGNVALVMVTATLPPFVREGGKIDINVASIADAKSLFGGVLLMTPLQGADGNVYAVAQGAVTIGGFGASGEGTKVEKNHLTVGRIPNGALVEQEVPMNMISDLGNLCLSLVEQDFTTVQRIEVAVNKLYPNSAIAVDGGTILVRVPPTVLKEKTLSKFISVIQSLDVEPNSKARVVINERTGTIVAGEHVKIGVVAISHGNLNVYVKESPQVSQPLPFSKGKTTIVPATEVDVIEEGQKMTVIEGGVSVAKVAEGLNALGVSPRDLVAIFQAIKKAGALYADLVIL